MFPTNVYAEHIEAFAQYPDIVQLSSEKFTITVDDDSYDMYYGYHGSLDSMTSDEPQPKLSSMGINQERKSLEITFDEVLSNSVFWVRMPDEVISAEKGHFQLFIDGIETRYDLTRFPNDYALGMIIPKGGEHIEIVGTSVIPEFSIMVLPILAISVLLIVAMTRKYHTSLKF
jgi:predicted secreted protein with PEFG-CTERM motif